jgi:hypothetical protein
MRVFPSHSVYPSLFRRKSMHTRTGDGLCSGVMSYERGKYLNLSLLH